MLIIFLQLIEYRLIVIMITAGGADELALT